ncbi:head decoration protein [Rhodococcoides fascians]|uniref:head decoration protein n=1 Tax=Rhodococcoides fascians TaxID=1828 RepID=UPI00050C7669|nr:head decoration protein [Rhodococcus fascians]
MTSIEVVSTGTFSTENRSWINGKHGQDLTPSITLDLSKFVAGTHYPNGYIPSGIVLGKITATGLYAPMLAASTDGSQTAAGHLFSSVKVSAGQTKVGSALFVHGWVNEARLPANHGLTAAARTALSKILYTDKV